MTKTKICGITTVNEAEYIREVSPDYMGMVLFFPKSKRNIELDKARELITVVKGNVKTVAVTVAPDVEQAMSICDAGFDYIQIHGALDNEVLSKVTIPIIRAFNGDNLSELELYSDNDKIVGFLFDAAMPGSGKVFDWNTMKQLKKRTADKIIFLAGGLMPSNVIDAISIASPDVVDVSSGVENDNGVGKDFEKIKSFIENVKKYH